MHAVATKVAEAEAAQAAAMAAAHARAQALAPSTSSTSTVSTPTKSLHVNPTDQAPATPPAPLVPQKSRVLQFFNRSNDEKNGEKTEKADKVHLPPAAPSEGPSTLDSAPPITATTVGPSKSVHPAAILSSSNPGMVDDQQRINMQQPSSIPVLSTHASAVSVQTQPPRLEGPTSSSVKENHPGPSPVLERQLLSPPALTQSNKLSSAQQRLYNYIGDSGITIIKHGQCLNIIFFASHQSCYHQGRQGAPKHRMLTCDDDVSELIVQASDSHYKKCVLSEVEAIRLGTDVDPATPKEVIERFRAENNGSNPTPARTMNRRASSRMSILGGVGIDTDGILYGTAILRRTCKKDDMSMCISLILPNRLDYHSVSPFCGPIIIIIFQNI